MQGWGAWAHAACRQGDAAATLGGEEPPRCGPLGSSSGGHGKARSFLSGLLAPRGSERGGAGCVMPHSPEPEQSWLLQADFWACAEPALGTAAGELPCPLACKLLVKL